MEDKVNESTTRESSLYNERSLTYRSVVSFTILTFCTFSIQDDKNGDVGGENFNGSETTMYCQRLLGHVLKVKPTCKKAVNSAMIF